MTKGSGKPKMMTKSMPAKSSKMPMKMACGGAAKSRQGGFPGIEKAPLPKKGK